MKSPPRKTIRLKLSEVAEQEIVGLKIEFQERSLRPIIDFFRWTNWGMLAALLSFALLEWYWPPVGNSSKVVTDKVLIAAVGGIAVQSGAILIAAFRGLFSK
jgi:uncharacterized membrane protein YjfL (UPF0719 family)